jgi:DNA repair protein SbcD/Mre11
MTKLLATGDWHVDAHPDYGREPGDRLADQRQTIEKIVDLAIDNDVDALLLAGDLWHQRQPSSAARLAVWEPLRRLHVEHPRCDILAIPGNHCIEAASETGIALEHFADIIDVHRQPGIWNTHGCAVATLPWTPISRLVATRNGGDRDDLHREAAALLIATARGLRAEIPIGQPAVLMTHFSISGAVTPTGRDVGPDFGVVLPLEELEGLGFDAVIAGHIHRQQVLCDDPFIAYVGSPGPVDFAEATTEHGCLLLDFDGGCLTTEYLPIASRAFVTVDVDFEQGEDLSQLLEHYGDWSDVADAVVRVRYRATEDDARHVDHGAVKRALYDLGAHRVHQVTLDPVRTDRARVAGVHEEISPLAAFDLYAVANAIDPDFAARARARLAEHLEAVAS